MTCPSDIARACEGKHPMPQHVAVKVAKRIGGRVSAYRCEHCGHYHVGCSARRVDRNHKRIEAERRAAQ